MINDEPACWKEYYAQDAAVNAFKKMSMYHFALINCVILLLSIRRVDIPN